MDEDDVLHVPTADEERHREAARRRLRRVIKINMTVPVVVIAIGCLFAPLPLRWLFLGTFVFCGLIPLAAYCPTCGKNAYQRRGGTYTPWPDISVCSKCGDRL